jgi:hypothetical protein
MKNQLLIRFLMGKRFKAVLFAAAMLAATVLPASAASAQDQAAAARTAAGCGPSQTQFDVKLDDALHVLAQPEEGKAIVYVFEDDFTGPTMRIGWRLDGRNHRQVLPVLHPGTRRTQHLHRVAVKRF